MAIDSIKPKNIGGAGTPGGSNGQFQFNDNGVLGGIASVIINGTITEISEQLLLQMRVDKPLKVEVSNGTIWTLGFWQASNGTWWLLGNTADVTSFTRADAEFYIPLGNIADVPAS